MWIFKKALVIFSQGLFVSLWYVFVIVKSVDFSAIFSFKIFFLFFIFTYYLISNYIMYIESPDFEGLNPKIWNYLLSSNIEVVLMCIVYIRVGPKF